MTGRYLIFLLILLCGLTFAAGELPAAQPETEVQPEVVYLAMKPLQVPVISEQGVVRQVSVVVSLAVPSGKTEQVEAMMPRLADAFFSDLYNLLGEGGATLEGGAIDTDAIRTVLAAKTRKLLGPDMVNDVLLQVVQQTKR
jgi:hypothetical protein